MRSIELRAAYASITDRTCTSIRNDAFTELRAALKMAEGVGLTVDDLTRRPA